MATIETTSAPGGDRLCKRQNPSRRPLAQTSVVAVFQPPKPVMKHRTPIVVPTLKAGNRSKAESYFNEGILMQQQGRLVAAIALYTKAVSADPTFSKAYYNMAIAYQGAKQTEKALDNYELALAANQSFSDAHFNYAILLQEEGYLAEALAQYEKFIELKPNDERGLFAAATLYSRDAATKDKARQYFIAYLKVAPNSPSSSQVRDWLGKNPAAVKGERLQSIASMFLWFS